MKVNKKISLHAYFFFYSCGLWCIFARLFLVFLWSNFKLGDFHFAPFFLKEIWYHNVTEFTGLEFSEILQPDFYQKSEFHNRALGIFGKWDKNNVPVLGVKNIISKKEQYFSTSCKGTYVFGSCKGIRNWSGFLFETNVVCICNYGLWAQTVTLSY